MTPYYEDASVTVHHGDCLDVLRGLPDASVDAVVTDPPYNLSFMAKPWDAYEGREDAGFAYWLTGLIDGEGHFAIKQHTRGTHAPYFALKMRADERGVLERIQRSLGVGTIRTEERADANPMASWVVQDKAGCQRLVDLLDKYPLRAKKHNDYLAWREAVCEWTARPRGNRWHGQTDNARMATLRSRLMETRAYTDIPWSGHEFQDWCRLWAAECLRVLKPGGHVLAFGGSRTFHRLTAGVEDAGFEVRDSIAWLYGSGFPKSLDVSKAIDKAAGAERTERTGIKPGHEKFVGRDNLKSLRESGSLSGEGGYSRPWMHDPEKVEAAHHVTAPATDAARTWQGWGTALKPAFEPVVVARKPLAGTVAANVLAHGTGALNVDGCRVGMAPGEYDRLSTWAQRYGGTEYAEAGNAYSPGLGAVQPPNPAGRWPANVVLDPSQAAALDEQSGELASGARKSGDARDDETDWRFKGGTSAADAGGASRFFPVFGAAIGDLCRQCGPGYRIGDDGCRHGEAAARGSAASDTGRLDGLASRFMYTAKADASERVRVDGTAHPTVKPLALMRWLVRLVTPPGGTVLEPFAGSGTTVEAAILEGFRCIAIEREADYLPLIRQRIHRRRDPVQAVRGAGEDDLGLFGLLDGEAS